jgi:hypothetical protein
MSGFNLSRHARVTRAFSANAAGATTLTSSAITQYGVSNLTAIVSFGAIGDVSAGTPVVKFQGSSDDSNYADIVGASVSIVAGMANKEAILELVAPKYKYYKLLIVRGGGSNDPAIVASYVFSSTDRVLPVTQDSNVYSTTSVVEP